MPCLDNPAMDCPRCRSATVVLEKRDGDRRRRECSNADCLFRFTTYELLSGDLEHLRDAKHQLDTMRERMREILAPQENHETRPGALGEMIDLPL